MPPPRGKNLAEGCIDVNQMQFFLGAFPEMTLVSLRSENVPDTSD